MDNFHRQTASGSDGDAGQAPGAAIPPTLDGYRTGRLLGTGGSARVWLVEDQRTGAARALKVLHRDRPCPGDQRHADDERLAQLRRENAVLGTLRHPHLLGMHGVVPTDQGAALLTDYAAGGSLHNLVVARGRLTVGECITVLAPVGQALSYLHSSSVSHGDISPGNVLFTAEGMPVIGDLATARLLGEKTRGAIGTAGFSAAVNSDEPTSGSAGDVYSLAALGWYALTGRVPGPAKDRVPLSLLVPEVSAEMLHALESGLQEEPAARPSAAEFAEAVLRSGTPQPLDLVAAVHPSVLPELITRRASDAEPGKPPRRISAVLVRMRTGRPPSERKQSPQSPQALKSSGRHSAQREGGTRVEWKSAVLLAVAAALVTLGTLLVIPYLVTAVNGTGGSGSASPADRGHPDNGLSAPAGQDAAAGLNAGTSAANPARDLSAEMQERLAEPDPVKALEALVGVRAMALTSADAGLLSLVNTAGSEAMDADQDLVAGLRDRGHVFSGLSIRVQEAFLTDALDIPEDAAAVSATVVMSGYTEADRSGVAVRTVADSTPQELVFILIRQAEFWRIASVHRAGAA